MSNKELVLKALGTFGEMNIRELAHQTRLDASRVRRTVRGLEATGAVRVVVEEDGRLWVERT